MPFIKQLHKWIRTFDQGCVFALLYKDTTEVSDLYSDPFNANLTFHCFLFDKHLSHVTLCGLKSKIMRLSNVR